MKKSVVYGFTFLSVFFLFGCGSKTTTKATSINEKTNSTTVIKTTNFRTTNINTTEGKETNIFESLIYCENDEDSFGPFKIVVDGESVIIYSYEFSESDYKIHNYKYICSYDAESNKTTSITLKDEEDTWVYKQKVEVKWLDETKQQFKEYIEYTYSNENDDWLPRRKIVAVYDDNGTRLYRTFYNWSTETNDWEFDDEY